MAHAGSSPNLNLNLKGLSILVADANPYVQEVLKGILRGFGATRVETADDGDTAHRRSLNEMIDLLICDCYLPGLDGFDLVRRIRHDEKNPNRFSPVIVLTSHTRQHNVEQARDCGTNLVLAKPISPRVIYERLLWIAEESRPMVIGPDYVGPDRRFRIEAWLDKAERRVLPTPVDGGAITENPA